MKKTWIDELFHDFDRKYGVQKTAAHFGRQDMAKVKADWVGQLEQFSRDTLRHALQAWYNIGKGWPPTAPELRGLCIKHLERQKLRPDQQRYYLPSPGRTDTQMAQGRSKVAALRALLGVTG